MARSRFASLAALVFVLAASGARAAEPDWEKLAAIRNIEVITHDEDGDVRETTIWFIELDGQGFIRTGTRSRWGKNVSRNPADLVLRIEGTDYPLRAEFIENVNLRERVTQAFDTKYGWSETLIGWIRGSRPKIMHVTSR